MICRCRSRLAVIQLKLGAMVAQRICVVMQGGAAKIMQASCIFPDVCSVRFLRADLTANMSAVTLN